MDVVVERLIWRLWCGLYYLSNVYIGHSQLRGVPAFLFIRHRASAAVSSSESNYLN